MYIKKYLCYSHVFPTYITIISTRGLRICIYNPFRIPKTLINSIKEYLCDSHVFIPFNIILSRGLRNYHEFYKKKYLCDSHGFIFPLI